LNAVSDAGGPAGAVAVQYLYACGIEVAPEKEDMGQLVTELRRTDAKAVDIARVIQAWPTVPRS
jgi:hypothetical protein